jgi:hypothetical protein
VLDYLDEMNIKTKDKVVSMPQSHHLHVVTPPTHSHLFPSSLCGTSNVEKKNTLSQRELILISAKSLGILKVITAAPFNPALIHLIFRPHTI